MNIAHVLPYYYPHLGGVESHARALAEELVKKRHRVTVIAANSPATRERETLGGVRIIRVPELANVFNTPVTPRLSAVLEDLHGRAPFDVIHAHTPPPLTSYQASGFAKKKGIPFVLTYHCDLEIPSFLGPAIVNIYRQTIGRSVLRRAKRIIVTTKSYAHTSRDLWNLNDLAVIPNAIDITRFAPGGSGSAVRKKHGIGAGDRVVLYVGRVVHHKGLEQFVSSAMNTDEQTKHLIVGDGPFREKLVDYIRQRSLEKKVILAGKVPDAELPAYYAACDIFILPSVSRLEAFGVVALEAMGCGKPVILSDMPGVRELITDGKEGYIARPLDAGDFAEKIQRILGDPALARRMGEAARNTVVEKFSWARVVDDVETVYQSLKQ